MVTDGVACDNVLGCSEDEDLGFVAPGVPPAEDSVDTVVDLTVDIFTDGVISKVLGCSEDDDFSFVVPGVPPPEDSVDTVVDLTVDVSENVTFSAREKRRPVKLKKYSFKDFNSKGLTICVHH